MFYCHIHSLVSMVLSQAVLIECGTDEESSLFVCLFNEEGKVLACGVASGLGSTVASVLLDKKLVAAPTPSAQFNLLQGFAMVTVDQV